MIKKDKKSKTNAVPTQGTKEKKLFENLLKTTQQFLQSKGYKPSSKQDLIERLAMAPQNIPLFEKILEHFIQEGSLELSKGRYISIKKVEETKENKKEACGVTGTIRMNFRGFGFVQADDQKSYPQDIFIPKHLTKNAIDGDRVEVIINQEVFSEKGPEGKVSQILSRGKTHLAGIIRQIDRHGDAVVYVPMLGPQQKVIVAPSKEKTFRIGDRIVMKVIDWGTKESDTYCSFDRYLGHISEPSCDISAAIQEFEIPSVFSEEVIKEAESFGKQVSTKEIAKREDLRHLTTLTIDPDTAKDFDDALSLSKNKKGTYSLGVHIADVSYYVRPGSALDKEANLRCNSTYFPGTCVPMLPGALSENLCSLKPNVNRLTVSVLMEFDKNGTMISHRMTRSVIKSAKRFTYKEAKKVIDGEKESPHKDLLHLMVELCRLLKKKRYERGSIEFSLPELVVMVDETGKPYDTDYITYDITHQMVEEFMLKANEIVAWDLFQKGKNLTYRVHEEPSGENLKDFSLLAAAFGFKISDIPTSQDLQKLFEEAGETPYSNYLASSYIRRMKMAAYSPENIGHYGLGLEHYCHFTSPIRRYVDLVVHRILFGESDDFNDLKIIADHCSERERISAKAENSVVMLKKLRLLNEGYKVDPYKDYEAIITKVKPFGIYFEILDLLLEGFIHISELEEDYFVYEEEKMRLCGTRKGGLYAPGDKISVILKSIDFIIQETKWYVTLNRHSDVKPIVISHKKKKKNKR